MKAEITYSSPQMKVSIEGTVSDINAFIAKHGVPVNLRITDGSHYHWSKTKSRVVDLKEAPTQYLLNIIRSKARAAKIIDEIEGSLVVLESRSDA